MKPKVKICGLTNIIDAKNALNLGADYVGFINLEYSLRYVTDSELREIGSQLSDEEKAKAVLLTDADTTDTIINSASKVGAKIVQPYHKLSGQQMSTLQSLGFEIFQPISIEDEEDLSEIDYYRNYVSMIILDTKPKAGEAKGGTGRTFNWDIFTKAKEHSENIKLALAGGLNVENIEDAISRVNPYMVDVSSGLESKVRIKSLDKMKEFFKRIHAIDCEHQGLGSK